MDRGVFAAGGIYEKGKFSIGAIDYYSDDIINIAYAETKMEIPLSADCRPRLALQFVDQRSTGDNLLQGRGFFRTAIGHQGRAARGKGAVYSGLHSYL